MNDTIPELYRHVARMKRGVIALPNNRGIMVGSNRDLFPVPPGWGFIDSADVTPQLIADTAEAIARDVKNARKA